MNPLWIRQIVAVTRFELGKSMLALRAAPIYLLAAIPVFVVLLIVFVSAVVEPIPGLETLGSAAVLYAHIFQFILRFMIYLGCVWIFMNLFRGEVLDRSLHYYFLTPIRREVLVVGKFVSGWIAASTLFLGSTVLSLVVLFSYFGPEQAVKYLLFGPGAIQLWGYAAVTVLACLGYGAVFLVVGLFLRNPIVPALLIWALEGINAYLPALLKKISVIFYLQSMLPVPITEGPFALVADPTPAWLAVPGLIVFTVATLIAAGLRIRHMEIAYGMD